MGVVSINSTLATFIRTVVILVMIAGVLTVRHQWQWPQGPVSKVASIDKLSFAFAIILGIIFLGENLTWQLALGASLIILGAMVIVLL